MTELPASKKKTLNQPSPAKAGEGCGPVYAADPPAARLTVTLDALVAVYHRPSGATHLLAAPSPELLEAFDQGPADTATLRDRLARRYDLEGDDLEGGGDDALDAIAARMAELVAAGLAWRA